ncbi:MAG: hypothetical protein KH264_02430 [Actinomyces graevenitzii]|jgi:hypothetical protein|nr:hypothetical protein [Actinomyces graevenitzii]
MNTPDAAKKRRLVSLGKLTMPVLGATKHPQENAKLVGETSAIKRERTYSTSGVETYVEALVTLKLKP